MYSGIRPRLWPPDSTTKPPPQTPHVARPASRLVVACFGGRPEMYPLSKRSVRVSVSRRRDWTRAQRSSSIMRSDSTVARIQSDSGRLLGAHLPHSFFFRVLFHTTTP